MMHFINFIVSNTQIRVGMFFYFLFFSSLSRLSAQARKELELGEVKSQSVYRKTVKDEPVVRQKAEHKKVDLLYYHVTKEAELVILCKLCSIKI